MLGPPEPLTPPTLPNTQSNAVGYVFDARGTQHVTYGGVDGHIYELLWFQGGWSWTDLTAAARDSATASNTAAPATCSGMVSAYAYPADGTQHVVYVGEDGNVWELFSHGDGIWNPSNLTEAAGAPPALSGYSIGPCGYLDAALGVQHVVYIGVENTDPITSMAGHVHELYWDGSWHTNDLTKASGDSGGSPGATNLSGYMFAGKQHVVYANVNDLHVHELSYDGTTWHYNDLTGAAGAQSGALGVCGYAFEASGTQHVVYAGLPDGLIHELYGDGDGNWQHNDQIGAAGVSASAVGLSSGFAYDAMGAEYVAYTGSGDGDVHLLHYPGDNNGWQDVDLTQATRAPQPVTESVSGYVFAGEGTVHVVYIAGEDSFNPTGVWELWSHVVP